MSLLMRSLLNGIDDSVEQDKTADLLRLQGNERKQVSQFTERIRKNREEGRFADDGLSDSSVEMLGRYVIPFGAAAKAFIRDQEGRGNAAATVRHYQQSIRKIKKFLCWSRGKNSDYAQTDDAQRIESGGKKPIVLLEDSGIEADLRRFLGTVEKNTEITVSTYLRDYRAISYWMMENRLLEQRHIKVKYVDADIKEVYTVEELEKLLKKPGDKCSFTEYRNWVIIN